ncbi:MAG: sensor hybrid histidine kinase [Fibrobacteres bacterium]|nr:sensor hybrid histidine kinase [Fibrobacterota bacterium]
MTDTFSILVVESNPQGLQHLVGILSGAEYSVTTAVSARQAFSLLFSQSFDLILLSIQLPNADGLSIAAQIRNREQSRTTPILLLSPPDGYDSLAATGFAMGNVDFLAKPVPSELLLSKVKIWVERAKEFRKDADPSGPRGTPPTAITESNLKDQDSRNRAAIDGMQDTAILWEDSNGFVVASNSQVRRILGYQEREILGMHASEFFSREDRDAGVPEWELRTAIEKGRALDERWHIRKDGSRIWGVGLVTPIWNGPGELEGFIKILRDRTDQKITEDLALDSEERYKRLLDSTVEGIFGFDLNAMCTFANVSCLSLLGYPDEQGILGLDLHLIMPHGPAEGRPCQGRDCVMVSAIQEEREIHREGEFKRANGQMFPVEYRIHTVRTTGAVIGAVVTFMDISERKRTEARLKAMERRFAQAQKLEAIGRLAGGIAHELNNDLTAVIGYGELLLDRIDDPLLVRPGLMEILQSGKRAADLVRKLLAFAGKQPIVPRPIQLESFLKERFPRFREAAGDRVQLSLELDPDLPQVFSEPTHLEQAILSILANAREAMAEEGSLSISARKQDLSDPAAAESLLVRPGIYDCVSIQDTGRGIPVEIQERLFDPFFSTKEMGRFAVGLGLSSAYGIIHQCGGTIHVESRPGEGSAVQVYLPTNLYVNHPQDGERAY